MFSSHSNIRIALIMLCSLLLTSCCMRLSQDPNAICNSTQQEWTLFDDMARMAPPVRSASTISLSEQIKAGEALFTGLCSRCHVYTRSSAWARKILLAKEPNAKVPPELNSERFQSAASEEYLRATIEYGINQSFSAHSMPAWKEVLNEEDIQNLVAYIIHIGAPAPMAPAEETP